ncbi:MAG: AAA family ATPase [Candidatus Sumerlaeota bacterium]|nr:AAA family ATPase [Candidatus Sumerlaeota bacterium]
MQTPADKLHELEILIRAHYPIIYVISWEEQRVLKWIQDFAQKRNKRVFEWSCTTGMIQTGGGGKARSAASADPVKALDDVMGQLEPAMYVFKDFHPYLGDRAVRRKVKECAFHLKDSYKTLLMVSPILDVPPELEKEITVVDFPLPDTNDFAELLDRILSEVKDQPNIQINIPPVAREQLLKAALGLTVSEAENVFAKILVNDSGLKEEDIGSVFSEKKQIIRKNGLLEYYEADIQFGQVGGLDLLKEWLRRRAMAFTDKARAFGLPSPKGVLLLGVQGCGKSLCAKAVSALWRMPLLRLDIGRMFGSLVGSSEENMRRALQVAESIAPVVLWLDEIDKALAGSRSSGSTDSGTTARVFGTFLTWLSEKTSSVFVIATANNISSLPPELMRKGRFDEIFFVDLPSDIERKEIYRIHLARRKRDPKKFNLDTLARASVGFSGAEIEESVISALYDAFWDGKDLSTEHIQKAIRETVPLSKTMEDDLTRLRDWSEGRARPSSSRQLVAEKSQRKMDIERSAP